MPGCLLLAQGWSQGCFCYPGSLKGPKGEAWSPASSRGGSSPQEAELAERSVAPADSFQTPAPVPGSASSWSRLPCIPAARPWGSTAKPLPTGAAFPVPRGPALHPQPCSSGRGHGVCPSLHTDRISPVTVASISARNSTAVSPHQRSGTSHRLSQRSLSPNGQQGGYSRPCPAVDTRTLSSQCVGLPQASPATPCNRETADTQTAIRLRCLRLSDETKHKLPNLKLLYL